MTSSRNELLVGRSVLPVLLALGACTVGTVKDSAGVALSNVEVTAYSACGGAGCDAHRVQIPVRAGTLTGYRATSNTNGNFFYDPYAKVVAPADAMAVYVPQGSANTFYKLQLEKDGYRDIWLDFTPDFEEHVGSDGKTYLIASVPPVYMCRVDEPDTDGDKICNAAEAFYGTNAQSADSDGDGLNDARELFGTGSPIGINTLKILHANVNVSNFATSKSFYMLLGFTPLLELDVNVTDPAEAAALNLPPYQLHAAPMALSDGYVIDLIRWQDPYDPSSPYATPQHLGIATLSFATTNLQGDMAALTAHGVAFTGPEIVDRPVAGSQRITLTDPDGTLIEVVQPGNVATGGSPNASGLTYITGALQTNVNVSDYEQSRAFYEMLGFAVDEEYEQGSPGDAPHVRHASMSLPQGHALNLQKWEDPSDAAPPYASLNHLGIARIAVLTANIEADVELLEDQGVAFYSDPITPSGPLGILRYACFEDPDGTVIELVQYN